MHDVTCLLTKYLWGGVWMSSDTALGYCVKMRDVMSSLSDVHTHTIRCFGVSITTCIAFTVYICTCGTIFYNLKMTQFEAKSVE